MKELWIVEGVHSIEGVHGYLAENLEFPDYYGENWNALFDALTDVSEDVVLRLLETDRVLPETKKQFEILKKVLLDAAEENSHLHIRLSF